MELPLRRFVLLENRNARRMANVKQNAMLSKTVKLAEGSRESEVGSRKSGVWSRESLKEWKCDTQRGSNGN